jgi:hypothetical protein
MYTKWGSWEFGGCAGNFEIVVGHGYCTDCSCSVAPLRRNTGNAEPVTKLRPSVLQYYLYEWHPSTRTAFHPHQSEKSTNE